jgi:hypothetical protein
VLWHTNVVLSVTGLPDELSKLISHAWSQGSPLYQDSSNSPPHSRTWIPFIWLYPFSNILQSQPCLLLSRTPWPEPSSWLPFHSRCHWEDGQPLSPSPHSPSPRLLTPKPPTQLQMFLLCEILTTPCPTLCLKAGSSSGGGRATQGTMQVALLTPLTLLSTWGQTLSLGAWRKWGSVPVIPDSLMRANMES